MSAEGWPTTLTSTADRYLFIVSRNNASLANYLQQHFKDDTTVQVVIDRRHGERRRRATATTTEPDRRRKDRRSRPAVDRELRLTSYAIVTLP